MFFVLCLMLLVILHMIKLVSLDESLFSVYVGPNALVKG